MTFLARILGPRRSGNVAPIYLYNTLGREKQRFERSPGSRQVRMYNCGPTVYGRQHIGNLSMFVFTDVLRRTLEYNDLSVKQVINFTDFGHLSSDGDHGDDKMAIGLKREKLKPSLENMRVLGEKYANIFLEDIRSLNVDVDKIQFPRASDYVPAQIAMIRSLEEKGYAYRADQGVYFDTSRFAAYGKLGNIDIGGQKPGARVETDPQKRNPTDFLLWKSSKRLGWDSPWGVGFPGWHIECSAMIRAILGERIDIHTGGIEHIPVHHNNEIAQSECATGKHPLARFWLHRAHLQVEGTKLAKSTGNVIYLTDLTDKGYHPLSLRYLLLGAHYRTPSNFTWQALTAAQTTYGKLLGLVASPASASGGTFSNNWRSKFRERINDDLDTPGALAIVWSMVRDGELSPADLRATLLDFDQVLGLKLAEPDAAATELARAAVRTEMPLDQIPPRITELLKDRLEARTAKNWQRSDELRTAIEGEGYELEDGPGGTRVFKQ